MNLTVLPELRVKTLRHYPRITKSVSFCKRVEIIIIDKQIPPMEPLPPPMKIDILVHNEGRSIFNGRRHTR